MDDIAKICSEHNTFLKNDKVWNVRDGVSNVTNLVQPMIIGTLFQQDGPIWKKARKELKKVSIESVRSRMKDAEKEGLTYDEYCAKYRLHKELSLI